MSRVAVSPASWLELRRGAPKQPALIGERNREVKDFIERGALEGSQNGL